MQASPTDATSDRFQHKHVDLGDVRLHCVEAGIGQGQARRPLARLSGVLWSWRHQIQALADAGFHVVAPDMRGYNLSDKPAATKAYRIEHLVKDVARLIRAHASSAPTSSVTTGAAASRGPSRWSTPRWSSASWSSTCRTPSR